MMFIRSEFNNIDYPDLFDWTFYYKAAFSISPLLIGNNAVYVNISLLPCPPGFMLMTDSPFKCDCNIQSRSRCMGSNVTFKNRPLAAVDCCGWV